MVIVANNTDIKYSTGLSALQWKCQKRNHHERSCSKIVSAAESCLVTTFGTGVPAIDSDLEQAVEKVFDLTPSGIIRKLELRKPIYRQLAAYGHMGREDLGVCWEKCDAADKLKEAISAQ